MNSVDRIKYKYHKRTVWAYLENYFSTNSNSLFVTDIWEELNYMTLSELSSIINAFIKENKLLLDTKYIRLRIIGINST